jgi:hypothetical protein
MLSQEWKCAKPAQAEREYSGILTQGGRGGKRCRNVVWNVVYGSESEDGSGSGSEDSRVVEDRSIQRKARKVSRRSMLVVHHRQGTSFLAETVTSSRARAYRCSLGL